MVLQASDSIAVVDVKCFRDSRLKGATMKKTTLTIAAISLSMMMWAATAADMAPRYTKAPPSPVAVAYNWTGFYIGGHVGAARDDLFALDVTPPLGGFFTDLVPAGTEGFQFRKTGFAGGVHGGGQMQWQQFVFGVEASWTALDVKQTIISPYFPATDTETGKVDNLVMVVGRVGYAFDRVMLYAKGGYAGGDVDFRARDNAALVTYQRKLWQNGYAIGGGLEYALLANVILGVDYTHVKLDAATSTGPNVFDGGGLGANPETYRTDAKIDMLTARLSYKFGGPIVARY
jgi:outer membrane immunogenic protein